MDNKQLVLNIAPELSSPDCYRAIGNRLRPVTSSTKKQRVYLKSIGFEWNGFAWSKQAGFEDRKFGQPNYGHETDYGI